MDLVRSAAICPTAICSRSKSPVARTVYRNVLFKVPILALVLIGSQAVSATPYFPIFDTAKTIQHKQQKQRSDGERGEFNLARLLQGDSALTALRNSPGTDDGSLHNWSEFAQLLGDSRFDVGRGFRLYKSKPETFATDEEPVLPQSQFDTVFLKKKFHFDDRADGYLAVPEPSAFSIMGLGLITLLVFRHRHKETES